MSLVVSAPPRKKLSDVLTKPVAKRNIKLVDVTADSFFLDPGESFVNQKGAYVFELVLRPSVLKVFSKKILSYNLKFYNPVTRETTSDYPISFYEDFNDIMGTGETDTAKIIKAVMKPQPVVIASDSGIDETLATSVVTSPTTTGAVLGEGHFGTPPLDFKESCALMLAAGVNPDDAAQLSMPAFPVSSTGYSLDGNGSESVSSFRLKKEKAFLIPAVGEKISLNKLRKEKLDQVAPKVDSLKFALHEFSALKESLKESPPTGPVDLGKVIDVSTEFFTSKRRIELDKNFVTGGKIYAIFTPVISDELGEEEKPPYTSLSQVESESVLLDLAQKIINLNDPEVPPQVSLLSNTPGNVVFSIKKNDPTTQTVKLTIKHLNRFTMESAEPSIPNEERTYSFESHVDEVRSDILKKCTNKDPYMVQLTVQAIGPDGSGGVSTTTDVPSHPSEYLEDYRSTYIVINGHNNDDGSIRLEITEKFSKANKVQLWREDLSKPTSSPLRRKLLTEFVTRSEEFSYVDSDVIPGSIYRYYTISEYTSNKLKGITTGPPTTENVESSDDEIIQAYPGVVGLYNVAVEKVGARDFRLSVEISRSEFQMILDELQSKGASSSLVSEINSQKSNLEDLAYFIVERIDRSSGQREFMKVIKGDEVYSDRSALPYIKYMYVFKLAVVNPEPAVILSNISESAKSDIGERSLTSYVNFLTQKITNSSGIIETADTYFSRSDKFRTIKAGLTAKQVSYVIEPNFNTTPPKMKSALVVDEGYASESPALKLRWAVGTKTDLKNIDSFWVYCTYQGRTTVLQTVGCSDTQTNYSFVDKKYYNEVGTKTYFVIARYKDYTFGPKSNVITKKKIAPIPLEVLNTAKILTPAGKLLSLKKLIKTGATLDGFFEG